MNTESKRLVVEPNSEVYVIDSLKCFGWKMISRNEVMNSHQVFDSAISYSYNGIEDTTVNTHTEVDHFVSLLFERDLDLPHLPEIRLLENDFYRQQDNTQNYLLSQRNTIEEKQKEINDWEKTGPKPTKGEVTSPGESSFFFSTS
jgi:hypothetical protein